MNTIENLNEAEVQIDAEEQVDTKEGGITRRDAIRRVMRGISVGVVAATVAPAILGSVGCSKDRGPDLDGFRGAPPPIETQGSCEKALDAGHGGMLAVAAVGQCVVAIATIGPSNNENEPAVVAGNVVAGVGLSFLAKSWVPTITAAGIAIFWRFFGCNR